MSTACHQPWEGLFVIQVIVDENLCPRKGLGGSAGVESEGPALGLTVPLICGVSLRRAELLWVSLLVGSGV